MPSSLLIWEKMDHRRIREHLKALGEEVSKQIRGSELLSRYRSQPKFQREFDDIAQELAEDCVRRAFQIYCNNSNQPASTDFKRVVWEHGINLFINGSPGKHTFAGDPPPLEIPDLLNIAFDIVQWDSTAEASEKKSRIRTIMEQLSATWQYELAPAAEMIWAVELLTSGRTRRRQLEELAFQKDQHQASGGENPLNPPAPQEVALDPVSAVQVKSIVELASSPATTSVPNAALSKSDTKERRDATIRGIWSPRKKGNIDYEFVCNEADRQQVPFPESWRELTWARNLNSNQPGSRDRVKKLIHDAIRPPKRKSEPTDD